MITPRKEIQWLVLFAATVQLVSPGLSAIGGSNVGGADDPKITPAGYAFVVWGVITILAFAYAIYQFRPNLQNASVHHKIAQKLSVVYLCFAAWLVSAEQQWLIATVVIFVVMHVLLQQVLSLLLRIEAKWTTADKVFLLLQVGVYSGWTTVAIVANTASALKFYGFSDEGDFGIIWQSVLLILAAINVLIGVAKFWKSIPFVLTTLWALVGIYFGLADEEDVNILRVITVAAIITVSVFFVLKIVLGKRTLRHTGN